MARGHRARPGGEPHERQVRERSVVSLGDLPAPGVLALEEGKLRPEDRRLDLVEPRVPALPLGVVAAVPAVLAQLPEAPGDLRVVGGDGAAVAVGTEVLRGIERKGSRSAEAAGRPALEARAVALSAVFDDERSLARRERAEPVEIGDAAVEMDRQQEPGLRRRDAGGERCVERERFRVGVGEDRFRAGHASAGQRRRAGVGREDDVVSGLRPGRGEREGDRFRAVGAGNDVGHADRGRELLFEAPHLFAENEPPAAEHPENGRVDRRALFAVVLGQGSERHTGRYAGRSRAHVVSDTAPAASRA